MSRLRKKLQQKPELSLQAKWQAWYSSKSPVLQFVFKFGVLLILFYSAIATPYFDRMLYDDLVANAWLSNAILDTLGQGTQVSGTIIRSPQFAVTIQRGCDAVEPTWLYCAAVLSFPAPWRHKLLGMLAGIVLLQALNLVRLVTLFWIGQHWPTIFPTAHLEIWPVLFIGMSLILFVSWKSWSVERRPPYASA